MTTINIPGQSVSVPTDPAIAAEVARAAAAEAALSARIAKLEGAVPPVIPPVVPPATGTAPAWWVPATTTKTAQIPPSIDATGTSDVTAALQAFIANVPDGSVILGGGPSATYKHKGTFIPPSRNQLTFDFQGATLNNIADGNAGLGGSWGIYNASTFFLPLVKPYPTHLTFRNAVITAASPKPGTFQSGEFAAFLHSMGGLYIEVTNITASGLFGDFVTMNEGSSYVWAHDNHVVDCGRNMVSVVCGSHLVVENNKFDTAGYCSFDVEPEPGSIAGSADLIYQTNQHKSWANCFFALDGSDAGKAITDVTVDSNTVSGSSLLSVLGGTKSRAQRVTFTNNKGSGTANVTAKNIDAFHFAGNTGATLVNSGSTLV